MNMCICVCIYKDLWQELAHVVLEIKKSHRLKSQGCNSVQIQWAKNLGGWWDKAKFESESQESKYCVQKQKKIAFSTQAKKSPSSIQTLSGLDDGYPHCKRLIFTQSTDSIVSRDILTDTPRNNDLPSLWAPFSAVKLTHKMNHHIRTWKKPRVHKD